MLLRLLVPFAIALAVYGAWLGRTRPVLTGDEPCYLVQAYSLVQDGDLDLSNNFRSTDPRGVIRFTGEQAGVPKGCAEDFTGDGVLRTWFNPGLPLLLTPAALLVPRSLPLLRVPMVILAALWAQQMYGLLRDVSRRRGAAELVWGGSLLLLPALGFSNQLYPEVPAALGVRRRVAPVRPAVRHRPADHAPGPADRGRVAPGRGPARRRRHRLPGQRVGSHGQAAGGGP